MVFIILCAVFLLLLFIMLLWIRLSLVYNEDGAKVAVKILFFKLTVVGKKKRRPDKKDFKVRRFRRRRKKALAKYRKKLSKTKKKTAEKTEAAKKPKKKSSPKELISKIIDIFGLFLKRFPKYLRIDCARLIVGVGGKDAASVAISYGVTVQSVQYVATLLNSVTNFKAKDDAQISVYPDFVTEKWTADINIVMRLRVIHIVKLGFAVLRGYLRHKLGGKKQTKNKSADTQKAA